MSLNFEGLKAFKKELKQLKKVGKVREQIYDVFAAEFSGKPLPNRSFEMRSEGFDTKPKVTDISGLVVPPAVVVPAVAPPAIVPSFAPAPTAREQILKDATIDGNDFVPHKKTALTTGSVTVSGVFMFRDTVVTLNPVNITLNVAGETYEASVGLKILLLYRENTTNAINNHWGKITEGDIKNYIKISVATVAEIASKSKLYNNITQQNIVENLKNSSHKSINPNHIASFKIGDIYYGPTKTEIAPNIIQDIKNSRPLKSGIGIKSDRRALLQSALLAGNDSRRLAAELRGMGLRKY